MFSAPPRQSDSNKSAAPAGIWWFATLVYDELISGHGDYFCFISSLRNLFYCAFFFNLYLGLVFLTKEKKKDRAWVASINLAYTYQTENFPEASAITGQTLQR